jgi:hypothetical protein
MHQKEKQIKVDPVGSLFGCKLLEIMQHLDVNKDIPITDWDQ